MEKRGNWRIVFQWMTAILLITACAAPVMENPASPPDAVGTQDMTDKYPLVGAGEYAVGIRRNIEYVDADRQGRKVSLTIWYPAEVAVTEVGLENKDAPPNLSGAPYPLILSSSKVGFLFAPSLVSHGFVYIGVNRIDSYKILDENMIDQPLDILFALRSVADDPPEWLAGLANTDVTGTIGYSFDGYNSLAMSGARVDPQAYQAHCDEINRVQPPPEAWYVQYLCTVAQNWPAFAAHAGESLTTIQDGLWQPMTDERIRAVMPMSPDGAWLFNERGLAVVDRPIFIITAEDEEFFAPDEIPFLFDHLGTEQKYLVTFLNRSHMMISDQTSVNQMAHFANAFFGYFLQGREDYLPYFSEEFVERQADLAWGVYTGE